MKRLLTVTMSMLLTACGAQHSATGARVPGSSGTVSGQRVSFQTVSAQVLVPQCVRCHGSRSPSAGLDLTSFTAVRASANIILQATEAGSMPPDGSVVNTDLIRAWIDSGATQ